MPSKLEKFRRKLDVGRRAVLDGVLARLAVGNFFGLNVKKLAGHDNYYRVRLGDMRIQFSLDKQKRAEYTEVEFRRDMKYR